MAMKNIKRILIILLILAVITTIYYISPKTFLKGIGPAQVTSISVFDGQTGASFEITKSAQITHILNSLQGKNFKHDGLSIGNMGYGFRMTFEGIDEEIILNSNNTVRKAPFFYTCDEELCFDYLKELEENE